MMAKLLKQSYTQDSGNTTAESNNLPKRNNSPRSSPKQLTKIDPKNSRFEEKKGK